jgi:acetyl esterase/lipase
VDGDAEAVGESKSKSFRTIVPPDYPDVAYGALERNRLDFWRAKGEGPRPLLVWIHGGGLFEPGLVQRREGGDTGLGRVFSRRKSATVRRV